MQLERMHHSWDDLDFRGQAEWLGFHFESLLFRLSSEDSRLLREDVRNGSPFPWLPKRTRVGAHSAETPVQTVCGLPLTPFKCYVLAGATWYNAESHRIVKLSALASRLKRHSYFTARSKRSVWKLKKKKRGKVPKGFSTLHNFVKHFSSCLLTHPEFPWKVEFFKTWMKAWGTSAPLSFKMLTFQIV